MAEPQSALTSGASALSSLGLYSRRVTSSLVGRTVELTAIRRELAAAQRGLTCLAIEGEPGIGKTRLVVSIEELSRQDGFAAVAVTADEEIRGPFLLARSIFGSLDMVDVIASAAAKHAIQRVVEALSDMDDPSLQSLAPDRKLLRVFDLAAVALRAIAAGQPVAVLIDDVQWADEDSLRMLRYIIRTNPQGHILIVLASRADEIAFVNEAVTLLADVDRMGFLRRIKLRRFTQLESTEFLQQVLGGRINLSSAAVMHAQAEGVPFILAEQAQTYRDAGLIQQIDGTWTLGRNAERLLPSAVHPLIQRRAARLPEATRVCLAEAAVLGRSFSLRDLRDMKVRLGDEVRETQPLAEALAPAVAAGLLNQDASASAADYRFTHDRVREYAAATLTSVRRRALHDAVVQLLTADSGSRPESWPLVAQHALAAGRNELAARASIEAARIALHANAPEEVLRLVSLAQPVASSPQDRIALLQLQDDALGMLRRPPQRLEGLAQLAALAEALGDAHLQLEVTLRRAAALRLAREYDGAANLARRVRTLAANQTDKRAELAACLELGQDLLRSEMGEGYFPTASEVDLDGAAEAYSCAATLAEQLGEDASLAASTRELGVIAMGRARALFVDLVKTGQHLAILQRIAAGERLEDILPGSPIAPLFFDADARFRKALDIYEKLGDRQGAMSTIIAMAYTSFGPDIHMPGSAKRIEDIRHLATQLNSLTKESERALADAQMLYGVHVYSRAKGFVDAAIAKGKEAYEAARALGEPSIEFVSAGGVAMAYADVGAAAEAESWVGRAASVASAAPTPLRARLLETWRGIVSGVAGNAAGMREHLEKAVQIATEQGRPAARCEALACLALCAARLGAEQKDERLLAIAGQSAREALGLLPVLPGRPPWGAQAHAALARVALARADLPAAAAAGRAALSAINVIESEDRFLDVRLPAAKALFAGGTEEEKGELRDYLRLTLTLLMQNVFDENARVQWLRGPIGREFAELAGPIATPEISAGAAKLPSLQMSDHDTALLRLLVDGSTNAEIAHELGLTEDAVVRQLFELYAKIGAASRGDATSIALMGKLV